MRRIQKAHRTNNGGVFILSQPTEGFDTEGFDHVPHRGDGRYRDNNIKKERCKKPLPSRRPELTDEGTDFLYTFFFQLSGMEPSYTEKIKKKNWGPATRGDFNSIRLITDLM